MLADPSSAGEGIQYNYPCENYDVPTKPRTDILKSHQIDFYYKCHSDSV